METLSHLAANSVWATSQHAGNTASDQSDAMTAPGSPSQGIQAGDIHTDEPAVIPPRRDRTVVTSSYSAPRNPSPWHRADGTEWERVTDESAPGDADAGPWEQT